MKDLIERLDDFLKMTGKDILDHVGKISHEKALQKANEEYLSYREKTKNELSKIEENFIKQIDKTAKILKNGKSQ